MADIIRSAQLTQKEHSGPGGVSENFPEGWGRVVQAYGATHTRLYSQGEALIKVNKYRMVDFFERLEGVE